MTTWYSADLHIGHARICELADRPFASVEEMDDALVERWNETVSPRDAVYLLGDVAMGSLAESLAKVARLNGVKYLVPGNHDRVFSGYKGSPRKKGEWRDMYRDAGLYTLPEQWAAQVGSVPVALCHFPYEGDSHDVDRYADMRPIDEGEWLLHGHVHEAWAVRGRQINVGVDVRDFAPVSEEELESLITG